MLRCMLAMPSTALVSTVPGCGKRAYAIEVGLELWGADTLASALAVRFLMVRHGKASQVRQLVVERVEVDVVDFAVGRY